jgi:OHCU decarboxylase
MAGARPFDSVDALRAEADAIWRGLDPADWREAFGAHPAIGAGAAGGTGGSGGKDWSAQEQEAVASADRDVLDRLAAANRAYEARFGYIFIVCATGKTAGEMLALLDWRLRHDADVELPIAADEQRQITQLRLAKLLGEEPDITR